MKSSFFRLKRVLILPWFIYNSNIINYLQIFSDCGIDLDCQNSNLTCERRLKCVNKNKNNNLILLETEDVPSENVKEQNGEIIKRENG